MAWGAGCRLPTLLVPPTWVARGSCPPLGIGIYGEVSAEILDGRDASMCNSYESAFVALLREGRGARDWMIQSGVYLMTITDLLVVC